ncbi:hypothetical protein RHMOL_Rhmol06G0264600 [Rhododendron molle]|uniref:Uncharacterized protein n=1 Tax=Rhododendron molle TaxID=49168 RepID=A0ACC0NGN2_RHOML|nr:hypothetical protein RHMOL_Rhmol06G0264600 [Rhododendron molle]
MANTTILLHSLLFITLLFPLLIHPSESTAVPHRSTKSDPAVVDAEFLQGHNTVRASHNLPPLSWSIEMVYYAKWWAKQRRTDCALEHSTLDYGENLFWGQGREWTATQAVAAWAAEEAYYDYATNTCMPDRDCTHYTQMVWRTTTSVGCAKIKCLNGYTYVVCEYDPHGNIIGEWPY